MQELKISVNHDGADDALTRARITAFQALTKTSLLFIVGTEIGDLAFGMKITQELHNAARKVLAEKHGVNLSENSHRQ